MQKKLITKEAVKMVLRDYFSQYRMNLVYSIIAFILPSIGTLLIFYVPPIIIAKIVDAFSSGESYSLIYFWKYIALFGLSWLAGEACWRIGAKFLIKLETNGINFLGKKVFRLLMSRDYNFFSNNFVGSLTKKGAAYSRGFEMFTDTLMFQVSVNIFSVVFAVIILGRYSVWLPVVLLVSISVATMVGLPIVRRRAVLVSHRHDAASNVAGITSDALTNILAVKSFGNEKGESHSFNKSVDDYTLKYKKAADYQNERFDMFMSPLFVIVNVIGLIMSLSLAIKSVLPGGAILIVFSYYTQITRLFWEVSRIYRHIEASITESAEFSQMFLKPASVVDSPSAFILKPNENRIVFNNVSFGYENSNELFLENFNLEIKGNEKVGLVGPSGGGKTTITKLLLRFINLNSGSITIDGQDISQATQESLRKAIAYVPQEPLLFHRSLFENISYSSHDASHEDVITASKLARAHEFIEKLPHGYDTLVGERGIKLSGGQRQRVAIARAILKNSPILILDEATSALDSESEKYIQEGLAELMKNKTALVIAHRLSTIKHLDRIIVLSNGKIVQTGSHNQLIKEKGLYADLWKHQSGEFLNE